MKRTFNYTGRRAISRGNVVITLREVGGAWVFDAHLRLADYHFPHNAEVWIEAHRQNLWMQWFWGTISAFRVPANRELSEFDVPDGILFRVRVVQPPGPEHHKLVGEADFISFVKAGDSERKRRHLLEPVPDNLGQQLWKLDLESDPPRLLVNKDAKPNWKDLAKSPYFISLVYPEVLRRLLTIALIDDEWNEDDEAGGWQADWVKFALNLGGLGEIPPPDSTLDRKNWIEEAVTAFAQKVQALTVWDLTFDGESRK